MGCWSTTTTTIITTTIITVIVIIQIYKSLILSLVIKGEVLKLLRRDFYFEVLYIFIRTHPELNVKKIGLLFSDKILSILYQNFLGIFSHFNKRIII